jgi:hypothetical protein
MHYTDATSVKAKLLDDGIVDTLVSAGATNAFTLPFLINASQNANPVAQHQMLMAPELDRLKHFTRNRSDYHDAGRHFFL